MLFVREPQAPTANVLRQTCAGSRGISRSLWNICKKIPRTGRVYEPARGVFSYSLFSDHSQVCACILLSVQVMVMISYEPFWITLRASNESTYTLIYKHHISSSTIDKLRKNKPLNTTTINDLCRILRCPVEQIMRYTPSDEDQVL